MLLFFYGTLVAGSDHALARAVHARLVPLGAATTSGRLWAIADPAGWYPALVVDRTEQASVHGQLYRAAPGFGAADLAALDAFEDYRPGEPDGSSYLRRPLRVRTPNNRDAIAQVYVFNQNLPAGSLWIDGGNFAVWLAERGLRAFGDGH